MQKRWVMACTVLALTAMCTTAAWGAVGMSAADYLNAKQDMRQSVGLMAEMDTYDTAILDLILDPDGPGTWEVRASLVGPEGGPPVSAGLADFILDIFGDEGVEVTSALNRSVVFTPIDTPAEYGVLTAGFGAVRSDGDPLPELPGYGMVGLQNIAYAESDNDPVMDRCVLQGIGIIAGNDISTAGPVSWEANFLLASGTYSGEGWLTARSFPDAWWSLLPDLGGPTGLGWYGPDPWFGVPTTDVVSDMVYTPEPATLSLLALGGLALLRRRRTNT